MKTIFLFIFIYCWGTSLYSKEILAPETLRGVKVITTKQASELYKNEKFLFIDTRPILEYSEGHIPGALHVPYLNEAKKGHRFNHKRVASFKTDGVVVYCNGPECLQSTKSLKILIENNVKKDLYWYRKGLKGWYESDLPIKEGIYP